ncbi:MAG TPA: hypothetical protein VGD54_20070, partial [Steroidobacteraceae bacterium]
MPQKKPMDALSQSRANWGRLRLGFPPALNWVLLAYAVLAVAIGWAYAASRIHSDYERTVEGERNRLRDIAATLQSATLAMFNTGIGAAVAGVNELQSTGGFARAAGTHLTTTLQRQLTGGDYVRFLFLANNGRFALASRDRASESTMTPAWLTAFGAASTNDAWIGSPITDPERPDDLVIPIAQRVRLDDSSTWWAGALLSFDAFDNLYREFRDQVLAIGLVA